jgi:hypothetical protein
MRLDFLTAHPASVGETYFEHLCFAARFGASMLIGGAMCLVHALLPFLFCTGGSRRVRALHATLQNHSARRVVQPSHDHDLAGESIYNWSI